MLLAEPVQVRGRAPVAYRCALADPGQVHMIAMVVHQQQVEDRIFAPVPDHIVLLPARVHGFEAAITLVKLALQASSGLVVDQQGGILDFRIGFFQFGHVPELTGCLPVSVSPTFWRSLLASDQSSRFKPRPSSCEPPISRAALSELPTPSFIPLLIAFCHHPGVINWAQLMGASIGSAASSRQSRVVSE